MIAIAAAEGALYRQLADEDAAPPNASCLVATEGGRVTGRVWYLVARSHVELLLVQAQEELLQEGLLRAALNAAELNGAEEACCRCQELAPLLHRLGFLQGTDCWSVSLKEFFSRGCPGHKNKG